jgi:antitoxin (DNA-binding transcriptional repressor) of toxin-antitoxin stability system
MQAVAVKDLRNHPSHLTGPLERNEHVVITRHGKPIGVAVPLNDENLSIGLARATALQAWRAGEISLGKMAELVQMDKNELRALVAGLELPIIDGGVDEAAQDADVLSDVIAQ